MIKNSLHEEKHALFIAVVKVSEEKGDFGTWLSEPCPDLAFSISATDIS